MKAGVIEDDCWTRIGTPRVSHAFGKEARCEIRVVEVEPVKWKGKIEGEGTKVRKVAL